MYASASDVNTFGNVQLSGTGALGDLLATAVKEHLGPRAAKLRVRADTFGYLQRCYPGVVSKVDQKEAFEVGEAAARFALGGDVDGSVAIRRKKTKTYAVEYFRTSLSSVARDATSMPARFIARSGNNVTKAFIDYARPLVGDLPVIAAFTGHKVPKKR